MAVESIIPAVVHGDRGLVAMADRSARRSGPPLPRLAVLAGELPMLYGIATLDDQGRASERRIARVLGWAPGQSLDIKVVDGVILMRPDPNGSFHAPHELRVSIPAPIRHWCALGPGDRVLLVADPERAVLVVHTMRTLDQLVQAHHASMFGGDGT